MSNTYAITGEAVTDCALINQANLFLRGHLIATLYTGATPRFNLL